MNSLLDTPGYSSIAGAFPMQLNQQQLAQNPLMMQLQQMQQQAGQRASTATMNNLYNSGFGRSTFAPQIAGQSSIAAQQPYIQQSAQTGQNLQNNAMQNFLSMLGMNTQWQSAQDVLNEKRRQADMGWSLALAKFVGSLFGSDKGGGSGGDGGEGKIGPMTMAGDNNYLSTFA